MKVDQDMDFSDDIFTLEKPSNDSYNSWKEISSNLSLNSDWSSNNETSSLSTTPDDYIFSQLKVKIPLLILYSIVFFFSFFGNLLVVLVMTLHRRMTSFTNFFLTNLAVADLCVSIFCVYQNFAMYVIKDWYLGDFLCRMYHFINTLSYTASVIILVVVSGERYLAIVEPLRAKVILTKRKMVLTMVFVWIFSALYSCPRFLYFEVATYPVAERVESMCILRRDLFDTRAWDIVSLLLLYLLPLALLSYLYSKIAQTLYKSSRLLSQATNGEYGTFATKSSTFCCRPYLSDQRFQQASYTESSSGHEMEEESQSYCQEHQKRIRGSFKSVLSSYISFGSVKEDKLSQKNVQEMIPLATRDISLCSHCNHSPSHNSQHSQNEDVRSDTNVDVPDVTPKKRFHTRHARAKRPIVLKPSPMVLKARRKVIQMLIMVVVCFALCSLPFHARKMFQYFLPVYNHTAPVAYILTPITFLFMYSHSAVNPLLYTAMSRRFRASLRDLFSCRSLQGARRSRFNTRSVIIKVEGQRRVASQLL